jgi:cobalt-zinc-cadmium efflux system outer membrane protein
MVHSSPADHVPPLAMLLEHILENPVVRTAGASLKAAKAVADRESAAGWPSVSLLGQYQLDEGANTGIVGLSIPIPVLNANRSAVVTASAEVRVSEARMTQTRFAAEGQMKSLYVRYDATRKAVEALEPTAELATRAVTLATRGYELGEHDLGSVLLVRREALEAQLALLEAQYTHAAVKIELLVTSGRIPQ